MKPTDVLKSEHRVIERVLASLEAAAIRLGNGERIRPGFFVDASEFISGFADGCHHHKEEEILFPALVEGGLPHPGGPVEVMLVEHDQGRFFNRSMREAAERLAAGQADAAADVTRNALGFVGLLRDHIGKEDNILFQMADNFLGPPVQEAMSGQFDQVEAEEGRSGNHARFMALAGALEQEAAAPAGAAT